MVPLAMMLLLLYASVSGLFWSKVRLPGAWKAVFCLTVFPLGMAAMLVNLVLSAKLLPGLGSAVSWSMAHHVLWAQAGLGLVMAAPLAILVGWAWYRLLGWCSTRWFQGR